MNVAAMFSSICTHVRMCADARLSVCEYVCVCEWVCRYKCSYAFLLLMDFKLLSTTIGLFYSKKVSRSLYIHIYIFCCCFLRGFLGNTIKLNHDISTIIFN